MSIILASYPGHERTQGAWPGYEATCSIYTESTRVMIVWCCDLSVKTLVRFIRENLADPETKFYLCELMP